MAKTLIKVYFNNGCTTLMYNDMTTVEDIIRVVIKGRLSLNELRYRQCFKLRSTKLASPFKDFDSVYVGSTSASSTVDSTSINSNTSSASSSVMQINSKIDDYFWLRDDSTIKEWLSIISQLTSDSGSEAAPGCEAIDFWKLQLKIRYISNDLNEVKFKDPITFNYYYEQVYNDYINYVAPSLIDSDNLSVLLDLGCLEMRRSFQHMIPNVLDKKVNYEYLEKDVGLKRFFPHSVMQQKSKNLKKMIIKGLKTYENLNESECMLRFLDKLTTIWKYNQETYFCHLGGALGVPINVIISYMDGIVIKMNNSKEILQKLNYKQIVQVITELDEPQTKPQLGLGSLKIKIADAKELLVFKMDKLSETENMASLIDGNCSLSNKLANTIWIKLPSAASTMSECGSSLSSSARTRSLNSDDGGDNHSAKKEFEPKKILNNSVHIVNESDESRNSDSLTDLKNDVYLDSVKCHKIAAEMLACHEKLGSGQFGDVFRGTYRNNLNQLQEVAIKKLKVNDSEDLEKSELALIAKRFMREARIMQNFDHPHIIKIIGICDSETLAIVMELAKFGQLRNYLHGNREQIELVTLLSYCYQLSSAMAYLETKKYVHRDIAARNILVVNHECIKLSDFGLSREIDENIYQATKCKLPIKWMAPESINFRKFTSQSDVWMFGICAWEILSYGAKPFQGIKNVDVIKLIEEKHVLDCPLSCPVELYSIMLKCWEYDSMQRPSFAQIKEKIYSIYVSYRENKKMNSTTLPQSSSNGSSFHSNSSISSNLSNDGLINSSTDTGSATNAMMMMMMIPLLSNPNGQTASPIQSPSSSVASTSTLIPPKPPKLNKLDENSPTRFCGLPSQKPTGANYSLKLKTTYESENDQSFDEIHNDAIVINRKDIRDGDEYSGQNPKVARKDEPRCGGLNFGVTTNGKSSKMNDQQWLDEKFKSMGLNSEKQQQSPIKSQPVNSAGNLDLILRDQTLKFIQTISTFIRYLNGDNQRMMEQQLKEIVGTLRDLIGIIETIEIMSSCKKITQQISDLETCLSKMIKEFKLSNIENVVNSALEMARTANELFLTITKSTAAEALCSEQNE